MIAAGDPQHVPQSAGVELRRRSHFLSGVSSLTRRRCLSVRGPVGEVRVVMRLGHA